MKVIDWRLIVSGGLGTVLGAYIMSYLNRNTSA